MNQYIFLLREMNCCMPFEVSSLSIEVYVSFCIGTPIVLFMLAFACTIASSIGIFFLIFHIAPKQSFWPFWCFLLCIFYIVPQQSFKPSAYVPLKQHFQHDNLSVPWSFSFLDMYRFVQGHHLRRKHVHMVWFLSENHLVEEDCAVTVGQK